MAIASSAGLTFSRVWLGRGATTRPARWRRRHRRADHCEAVLHDARRGPCAVQRPSPSRVASPARSRSQAGRARCKGCVRRACHAANLARERGVAATEPRRRLPTMVGRHHGPRASAFTRPAPARPRTGRARQRRDASRAPATTFSYVFRPHKTRYASSPTSPCPSPTIRPSRTCAWRSSKASE